jgi:hypothetical protein
MGLKPSHHLDIVHEHVRCHGRQHFGISPGELHPHRRLLKTVARRQKVVDDLCVSQCGVFHVLTLP